jgi:tripartite-type tricarboxylate transporter receptor subunit TctC
MNIPQILTATTLALPLLAQAQGYPSQPIRFVVPYAAGGAADVVARQIAQHLTEALKQPAVLENKPGANTIVGAEYVARSSPDGHTLLLAGSSTLALNPAGYKKLSYDSLKDFVHIAKAVSNYHLIAARKGFAPSTIPELVALAKKKADGVSYASTGIGSPTHFAGLLIESMAGVKMVHVPYKGISQVVTDLLGENVDFSAAAPTAVIAQIRAGKLKALAATSPTRLPSYPEAPTMQELGFAGFTSGAWYTVSARAGTPAAIVARLNTEVNRGLNLPAAKKLLESQAFAVDGDLTTAQTTKFVADEIQKWGKIVRDANISFE